MNKPRTIPQLTDQVKLVIAEIGTEMWQDVIKKIEKKEFVNKVSRAFFFDT